MHHITLHISYNQYTYTFVEVTFQLENHTINLIHEYRDDDGKSYATRETEPEQIIACLEQLVALAEPGHLEAAEDLQEINKQRLQQTKEILNQVRGYLKLPEAEITDYFISMPIHHGPGGAAYATTEGPFYSTCACGKTNKSRNLTADIKAKINFTTGEENLQVTLKCRHQHEDIIIHEQDTLDLTQIPEYITKIEKPKWYTYAGATITK